ncbi:MAG TPA: DNA starvation/stationary phase protection protein [Cyanobacteria bacterium UBA8156]|jgi:starvation-inducible DNA-binding protein|nr:DNA starvation/stationary phase protection protein [Cyanobacteria bacterium UBA8156]
MGVVAALNRQQANALVLFLNYKKYHWLTFGPLFRDLHLLFEEYGAELLASIDELAERSLMLDGQPIADPADYLTKATVAPSQGSLTVAQMVNEAIAAHEVVIQELHADAAAAGEDIGTADLFTRLVQVHQKQRWFLREVARKGDGLIS